MFSFLSERRHPRSTRTNTLFRYTTLFRSYRFVCLLDGHAANAAHDIVGAARARRDPRCQLRDLADVGFVARQPAKARLGIRHDCRQRLIDFMGDRTGQLAEGRDARGVAKISLQLSELGLDAEAGSEERGGGKECVSTCRSWWSSDH